MEPEARQAAAVREVGPRAVSRTVLLRLHRLPEEAAAVAQAVAVLGDGAQLPLVAALAGLDEQAVAAATAALARADILRPEPPLGFVHPLVRDAVYHDLPPGERELRHAEAARLLTEAQAPAEEVATHLLACPPPRRRSGWSTSSARPPRRRGAGARPTAPPPTSRARSTEPPPAGAADTGPAASSGSRRR